MWRRLKVFFSLDKLFELNLNYKDKKKKRIQTLWQPVESLPHLSLQNSRALVPLLWIGVKVNKMHGLNGLKHC